MIKKQRAPNYVYRIRERIVRWKLEGIPAKIGANIERILGMLSSLVAPRIASAVLSTLLNRWCTPRRFQNRDSSLNVCLLGCPGLAEDSIEHYAHCACVRNVACRYLALGHAWHSNLQHFMLADDTLDDSRTLVCMTVLIYATYTATNIVRNKGASPFLQNDAIELVKQCCRNGVMGHSHSTKIINRCWINNKALRPRTPGQPQT